MKHHHELRSLASVLGGVDLFRALPPARLQELANATVAMRFPAGATVLSEGDDAEYVYVIVEGEIDLIRAGTQAARLGAGEYFGELGPGADVTHRAGAVAHTATALYALERTQALASAVVDAGSADGS